MLVLKHTILRGLTTLSLLQIKI